MGKKKIKSAFIFQLKRGKGATFFSRPESGFIRHQSPPPCCQSSRNEIKVIHRRCTGGEGGATSALTPQISQPGLSPKKVGDDITKGTGDWKGLRITGKLTAQNRQDQMEAVPSASAPIIKALTEPPRDRKKKKNKTLSTVELSLLVRLSTLPQPMQHRCLARELSGTIKEIWGRPTLGCNVDGCHPDDIVDDINSGTVGCRAS